MYAANMLIHSPVTIARADENTVWCSRNGRAYVPGRPLSDDLRRRCIQLFCANPSLSNRRVGLLAGGISPEMVRKLKKQYAADSNGWRAKISPGRPPSLSLEQVLSSLVWALSFFSELRRATRSHLCFR